MKVTGITPTRISLYGGGSDLPIFYNEHGGAVLSLAINIRQTIVLDDTKKSYSYLPGANPKFYEAFFKEFKLRPPSMHTHFDTVIESGLGSSASAAVALVGALAKFTNQKLTKEEIAEKAWDIEVNKLKLYGGKQDQYAATFGGANFIEFTKDEIRVTPIHRGLAEQLASHLVLVYTGNPRKHAKVQEELKKLDNEKIQALLHLKDIAYKSYDYLHKGMFQELGFQLAMNWNSKKLSNPKVTNEHIDEIYHTAMRSGAWGGKLCGSGSGGFMVFMCEPMDKRYLADRLTDVGAKRMDFSIDWCGLEVKCED